jgi:hypothetical protein
LWKEEGVVEGGGRKGVYGRRGVVEGGGGLWKEEGCVEGGGVCGRRRGLWKEEGGKGRRVVGAVSCANMWLDSMRDGVDTMGSVRTIEH